MKSYNTFLMLFAVACLACMREPTQVVVLVDSDLSWGPNMALQSVRITARDPRAPTGTPLAEQSQVLGTAGMGQRPIPFVVKAADGDESSSVLVTVTGCHSSGCDPTDPSLYEPIVTRSVIFSFVEGQTRAIEVFLSRRCADVRCNEPLETCAPDPARCVLVVPMPTTLWPPSSDGGDVPDATSGDANAPPDEPSPMDVPDASADGPMDMPIDVLDASTDGPMDSPDDVTADVVGDVPDAPLDAEDVGDATDEVAVDVVASDMPPTDVPCPSGQMRCTGVCVDTSMDSANCGDCGHACATGSACSAGACVSTCAPLINCSSSCVDLQTSVSHCGACGVACPSYANATPSCTGGTCRSTCNTGFGDCDSNPANGCETPFASSVANCGRCGNVCATGQVCLMGTCTITCGSMTNCSGSCVNLMTDAANCGACGNVCPTPLNSTRTCAARVCGSTCNAGFTRCGGVCLATGASCSAGVGPCLRMGTVVCGLGATTTCSVTAGSPTTEVCDGLDNDCDGLVDESFCRIGGACYTNGRLNPANNCQVCYTSATVSGPTHWGSLLAGTTCRASAGVCDVAEVCAGTGAACPADAFLPATMVCRGAAGVCDAIENCTGTTAACPADGSLFLGTSCSTPVNGVCIGSSCTCLPGQTNCGGTCRSLSTDITNCGTCGNACPARANATSTCSTGMCGFRCNTGFGDCDGVPANGCETSTNTSLNCGACGVPCSGGTCSGGVCTCSSTSPRPNLCGTAGLGYTCCGRTELCCPDVPRCGGVKC